MLEDILPRAIFTELSQQVNMDLLTEIRIRKNAPIYFAFNGIYRQLKTQNSPYNIIDDDINYIIDKVCQHSLYAYDESIMQGYISCNGGIRVGIIGEGVTTSEKLSTIKNFSSLCIRIPHQIKTLPKGISKVIENFGNTLIISRPGLGKTTILREIIRQLSNNNYNILVLDERCELSGMCQGKTELDLGSCSDIVIGVPKHIAYANYIRTMRPDIVATDEIFGEDEVLSLLDCMRCGVKVLATLHCDNVEDLFGGENYKKMLKQMKYVILLKGVGVVDKVYESGNFV